MRIDSKDTAISSYSGKLTVTQNQGRFEATESYSAQVNKQDKEGLQAAGKGLVGAIEQANRSLLVSNRKFEYSIHEKTNQIMIKVIDTDTNEVIREIPPEKILDMVSKMWELAGLIVDEKR